MILILIYGNEKKTFETLKNQGIPHFSTGHVFGMELHFISLGFGMVFPDMRSFGMVSPAKQCPPACPRSFYSVIFPFGDLSFRFFDCFDDIKRVYETKNRPMPRSISLTGLFEK